MKGGRGDLRGTVTMQALPGEKLDHTAIHGAWDFKGFRTGDTLVNKGKNGENDEKDTKNSKDVDPYPGEILKRLSGESSQLALQGLNGWT